MNGRLRGWMVPLLLLGTIAVAIAEEITLTTYYPSPRGVYNELRTAGNVQIGLLDPPAVGLPGPPRLHLVQGAGAAGDVVPAALRVDDEAPVGAILDATPFLIDAAGNVGIGTANPTTPAPNGQQGNMDANDVFLRSTGQWVSQGAGGPTISGPFTLSTRSTPTFIAEWEIVVPAQPGLSDCAGQSWPTPGGRCWRSLGTHDICLLTSVSINQWVRTARSYCRAWLSNSGEWILDGDNAMCASYCLDW